MARQEADREDLLREATALVERVELAVGGFNEPIVCGFRRDGSASFYFGADPVYQFNTAGQLRRAFVGGRLLKAERGRLVALARKRTASEVALVRLEMTEREAGPLLDDLESNLHRLLAALEGGTYSVTGMAPPAADTAGRVLSWLRNRSPNIEIAAVPNAR